MTDFALRFSDSRRSYRVAVGVLFFLQGLCFASWASRIPSIQQALGLNESELGLVLFALPVGSMFSLPFAGYIVSKLGSRTVATTALAIYSLILLMLGAAATKWQLIGVLLLFGVAGNLSNISINTQAVGVEAIYQRTVMASFHGMWSVAGFTAAAVGSYMIGNGVLPYEHFFIILGIILLTLALTYRYTLKEDVNAGATSQKLFVKPDQALLKLGLITFCSMICEGAMFDWSGIYFQKVVQAEKAWIGAGYTIFMCTMATGRFIADWFSTRFGLRRTLQVSGMLTATGLIISVVFPTLLPAMAGFFLVGFGVSSIVPLVYSAAGRSKTMTAGMALAAVSSIGFLGFLFGPPLIGVLAGLSSLRLSFTFIALMGLCITLIATKVKFD
ncbi:Nitrate/nitrite transporter NarK [Cnuella takakiae]|uniref:Nitrate/nitrite transporter NarK n=1 Tax=Cnuella takakiae TaxID=1302690 RepID=A0A1M4Y2N5_9BACT|nr:MFS transporter [Cnuella takakiae]OLY93028.1 MFS transporter [Cnuella takakiae]SHE99948.1 Nitrate/nitrite transporter NarK [Cnuella takakiae]